MQSTAGYKLVRLANGAQTVHAQAYGETMHPGLGPTAEAEALYVGQLKLRSRLARHAGEFVIWDVGLGAAANALTALRSTRDLPCPIRIVSFDDTSEPLAFAIAHKESLGYFSGYEEPATQLLKHHRIEFKDDGRTVKWSLQLADFPTLLKSRSSSFSLSGPDTLKRELQLAGSEFAAPPHAILFDAFSPAKNPAMWTLSLFTDLFRLLNPLRSCALTTYSRSTMFRVTLLLAGFFVGRGKPTGLKEETTVAANTLDLIDEPLDRRWLTRAQRSGSAEPLHEPVYRQAPLSPTTWERLQPHPQFR